VVNNNITNYIINVKSFSPRESDSIGTTAYKKLRRELKME
jgi:hypothetical protein